MDSFERFIFFMVFIYACIAVGVVTVIYGAICYFAGPNPEAVEADKASCEMWQYEFAQCADDRTCITALKPERPAGCRLPSNPLKT